jgi:hypothetical protein
MTTTAFPMSTDDHLAQVHEAYVGKVNALVAAGRDGAVRELAEAYDEDRAAAGRPAANAGPRPVERLRRTRDSLRRFDRYTLDVFNPGAPYRQP